MKGWKGGAHGVSTAKAGHENFARDTLHSFSVRISLAPQGKVKGKPCRGGKFPVVKGGEEFDGFSAHLIFFLWFFSSAGAELPSGGTERKEFCARAQDNFSTIFRLTV